MNLKHTTHEAQFFILIIVFISCKNNNLNHHLNFSGTSDELFDEFGHSMSPLAGTKYTVRQASHAKNMPWLRN